MKIATIVLVAVLAGASAQAGGVGGDAAGVAVELGAAAAAPKRGATHGVIPAADAGVDLATVPVPAALPLFLSALGLIAFLGRRRAAAA